MKPNTKEWIQYSTAILMITSGVLLAFLSFFLNNYDIARGVLWYIAQALVYAGGIFGVSLYFKTKLGDFESRVDQSAAKLIEKIEEHMKSTPEKTRKKVKKNNNETGYKQAD